MKSELSLIVRKAIVAHRMLESGDTCLVAVSGGPDSMALLHALSSLREEMDLKLVIAHLNHALRGPDSDADEQFVREQAAALALPLEVGRWDRAGEPPGRGESPEMAARRVRREFLLQARERVGARRIALGHTADDQVETVLLNILRGAGPRGMSGMRPVTREGIIRPLLQVTRAQVLAYLEAEGIPYRTDPSNLDRGYLRNRIRHELVPYLEARFSSGVRGVLLRAARIAAEEVEILERLGREVLRKLRVFEPSGENAVIIDVEALGLWPVEEQKWAIRAACEDLLGHAAGLAAAHIEQVLAASRSAAGHGQVRLPNGLWAWRRDKHLVLSAESPVPRVEPAALARTFLEIPGRTSIGELGIVIEVQRGRPGGIAQGAAGTSVEAAELDAAEVHLPVWVRTFRPGDRMRPLRLRGRSKKLKKLFGELRIPLERRGRQLVVEDAAGRILWAPGLSLGFEARVTEETTEVLRLTCRSMVAEADRLEK